MKKRTGLAVTGMMLVLASPIWAKDRRPEAGAASRFAPPMVPSDVLAGASQTVNLDSRGILIEDSQGSRMFGSLPVTDHADVGVGLFSVVGSTEKEQVRRRMDPSRAYLPADTRVAAVGFNLRF
ncbi:MAG: hypothetical protein ACJ8ER_15335 [Allosphingosinicella sp.]